MARQPHGSVYVCTGVIFLTECQNERGQNTHGQGERVKIPLLPNNVGKKSVKDAGPQQGYDRHLNSEQVRVLFGFSEFEYNHGCLFL